LCLIGINRKHLRKGALNEKVAYSNDNSHATLVC
jgi:hypothetical protein